mmetsp:Transcript_15912/g.24481  ORF Transcript_15912/g.24481 Transcript_15912/m.24481 type:complete len:187 (+) Transcript_15912:25-585(+)|eukprot:CAMPEP_0202694280 /NCGR_PEP_ID=MMETSP1385-20130828/8179_1 /ASSEMBLY_ACC=CAM_ASM_000861 /TAXON_ID=933848 /ORGANISM="Elphidium margaritaceum" /LENGTH=186 /DNA_ID=CAMNT_0049350095 /DNA_START=10 /DNA_END=570 /DNA_ORIENTATION=-
MPQRKQQQKGRKANSNPKNKNKKKRAIQGKRNHPPSAHTLSDSNNKHNKSKESGPNTNVHMHDPITSDDVLNAVNNGNCTSANKHKMSKALKYQADQLEKYPDFDYMLVGKDMDYGVSFNAMGGVFFKLCRNRAMETGEERSIGKLFQMLYDGVQAKEYGRFTVQDLKKQLLMEYGKVIDWDAYIN